MKNKNIESINEKLQQKQALLDSTITEFQQLKNMSAHQKEQIEEIRLMFDKQIDELRDAHALQVSELQGEISMKQKAINELKEYVSDTH